jgi:hypothetical protein
VAVWPLHGEAIDTVIARANREERVAKDAGKNCVRSAPQPIADADLGEATYYRYAACPSDFEDWPTLVEWLAHRYSVEAFPLSGRLLPITVVWKNTDSLIEPDTVLGELDEAQPVPMADPMHRIFIKRKFEEPPSPIRHESQNFRMVTIETRADGPPVVHGALGLYYDAVLTEFAIEWELFRLVAVSKSREELLEALNAHGSLPLRVRAEQTQGSALLHGGSRCAALTVSTFVVFRRAGRYYCLIRRRSRAVGISPGLFHVLPAAMFEATQTDYRAEWSVKQNVFRELLEEVYNEPERRGTTADWIYGVEPIPELERLLVAGRAEFSLTGLCVNLLDLRPEICTVLCVEDEDFLRRRSPAINWEFLPAEAGKYFIEVGELDRFVSETLRPGNVVPNGAVTMSLGREWLRQRHGV